MTTDTSGRQATARPEPASHGPASPDAASRRAERAALLRDASLRWLLAGASISMLGDQFTLLALPWTVLQLTHDPLVLGTVLAVIGVPRALFMLIGGAFVDRHSPQRVLRLARQVNAVLLAALALLVGTGALSLPLLYALALAIGVASAFAIPAAGAMLPAVVAPHRLPGANGLMMGLRQLSFFVGPLLAGLLAGLLVALAGGGTAQGSGDTLRLADAHGLAWAFGLDAASFAFSVWTLSKVRARALPQPSRQAVFAAVAEGLRSFWADRDLRAFLGYGAAVSLLVAGPVQTALPVLASQTPTLGAAALGSMMAAHGAGLLVGLAVAGARPHWLIGNIGLTVLAVDAVVGLLFLPLGQVSHIGQGVPLLAALGLLGGFLQLKVFTWLQQRVAPAMMGRAMSLFMFIFVGLAPVSAAATGALLRWLPLPLLFAGAGATLLAIVMLALLGSRMRQLGDAVPAARPGA